MAIEIETLRAHFGRDRRKCPLREWVFGLSQFGRPALESVALHASELSLVALERGIAGAPDPFANDPALREGVLAARTGAVASAHFQAASTLVTRAEAAWDEWNRNPQQDRLLRAGDSIVWMLTAFNESTKNCRGDKGPAFATWCAVFHCQGAAAAPSDLQFRRQLEQAVLERLTVPRSAPSRVRRAALPARV